MAGHLQTGAAGETLAAAFLQGQQYTIVARNYRYKKAEVDIIAQKGNMLVFVEVKTRVSDLNGWPEEAVSPRKQSLLLMAADHYIHHTDWQHEARFDIISITGAGPSTYIHHIEDAFH